MLCPSQDFGVGVNAVGTATWKSASSFRSARTDGSSRRPRRNTYPSFELNKTTLNAERYGLDFALSMIKLRGFGGKTGSGTRTWKSFTLMAGLAAVTSRIKLYATAPTLVMPPAIAARMAVDDRFDLRAGGSA